MNPKNLPTAFPVPNLHHDSDFNGMTLRDYFAAKAMQGMLADPEINTEPNLLAKVAYAYADGMIAERSK